MFIGRVEKDSIAALTFCFKRFTIDPGDATVIDKPSTEEIIAARQVIVESAQSNCKYKSYFDWYDEIVDYACVYGLEKDLDHVYYLFWRDMA